MEGGGERMICNLLKNNMFKGGNLCYYQEMKGESAINNNCLKSKSSHPLANHIILKKIK